MWCWLAQASNLGADGAVAGGIIGAVYGAAKLFEWFGPKKVTNGGARCELDAETKIELKRKLDQNNRHLDLIRSTCLKTDSDNVPHCYVPRRWGTTLDLILAELRKLNANGGVRRQ